MKFVIWIYFIRFYVQWNIAILQRSCAVLSSCWWYFLGIMECAGEYLFKSFTEFWQFCWRGRWWISGERFFYFAQYKILGFTMTSCLSSNFFMTSNRGINVARRYFEIRYFGANSYFRFPLWFVVTYKSYVTLEVLDFKRTLEIRGLIPQSLIVSKALQ